MKTKYIWPSLISPHANFHNDRKLSTVTLLEQIAGGGKGKRAPTPLLNYKTKMFKNCSRGNLHVKNVLEMCSPVHAGTFYCSF